MKKGDFVKIDYIGKLESGEIFDLTKEDVAKKENLYNEKIRYGPITVVIGAGFVIPGLEKAIKDMKPGDKKTAEIEPDEGFGPRKPDMVQIVNKKVFAEKKVDPQVGMVVDFTGLKGRIQSISSGRVTIDFNNPMAGKKLIYDIEFIEKIEKPEEQIKSLFEFFGLKSKDVQINEEEVEVDVVVPPQVKEKISSAILEFVKLNGKEIKKLKFTETFEKVKK